MGWDPAVVPDPQDPATFERSKLDWSESDGRRHAQMLALYRGLAALRRTEPELTDPSFSSVSCTADEENRVFTMRRGDLLVAVNFGDAAADLEVDEGTLLFGTPSGPSVETGTLHLPPHTGALLAPERS